MRSQVPFSAKQLFCLCQGSSEYRQLVGEYRLAFYWATAGVALLAALPLTAGVCFLCGCVVDDSRYFDEELL